MRRFAAQRLLAMIGVMEYDGREISVPATEQRRPGDLARIDDHERIGDLERSATCDTLSEQFAAGRLSAEDLDQRLNLAVHAVTRADLRRLTADLPTTTAAARPRPPATSRSWPVASVLAMVGLIGSVAVAGGMLVVLGLVSTFLFLGALVGGVAAAVGGASANYLLTQHVRLRRPGEE